MCIYIISFIFIQICVQISIQIVIVSFQDKILIIVVVCGECIQYIFKQAFHKSVLIREHALLQY